MKKTSESCINYEEPTIICVRRILRHPQRLTHKVVLNFLKYFNKKERKANS